MAEKSKYAELQKEYVGIYEYVKTEYDEMPSTVVTRLSNLVIHLARVGKMLAEVEYLLNDRKQRLMESEEIERYSTPSMQKQYLDSLLKHEQYLYKCVERLGSSIVHQIDALRSQLSYFKTELSNT